MYHTPTCSRVIKFADLFFFILSFSSSFELEDKSCLLFFFFFSTHCRIFGTVMILVACNIWVKCKLEGYLRMQKEMLERRVSPRRNYCESLSEIDQWSGLSNQGIPKILCNDCTIQPRTPVLTGESLVDGCRDVIMGAVLYLSPCEDKY